MTLAWPAERLLTCAVALGVLPVAWPLCGPRLVGRAPVRHGVSAIRTGERHTLALVFHDAV